MGEIAKTKAKLIVRCRKLRVETDRFVVFGGRITLLSIHRQNDSLVKVRILAVEVETDRRGFYGYLVFVVLLEPDIAERNVLFHIVSKGGDRNLTLRP